MERDSYDHKAEWDSNDVEWNSNDHHDTEWNSNYHVTEWDSNDHGTVSNSNDHGTVSNSNDHGGERDSNYHVREWDSNDGGVEGDSNYYVTESDSNDHGDAEWDPYDHGGAKRDSNDHGGAEWDSNDHNEAKWDSNDHVGTEWDSNDHNEAKWDSNDHVGTEWNSNDHVGTEWNSNDHSPQHSSRPKFDKTYYCSSYSAVGKPSLETGGRITMPASALPLLIDMDYVSYPMQFRIASYDLGGRSSHCGVLEFSAEEGFVYMPQWMMNNLGLNEGDLVTLANVALPKGEYLKLRPHTMEFVK